jgi:hypothetical protein
MKRLIRDAAVFSAVTLGWLAYVNRRAIPYVSPKAPPRFPSEQEHLCFADLRQWASVYEMMNPGL